MAQPKIRAVEVVQNGGNVIQVDMEWHVPSEDVTVVGRCTVAEARRWVDGLLADIRAIEKIEI